MRVLLRVRPVLLFAVAVAIAVPHARADDIDSDMARQAGKLVKEIRARKYTCVGVLNFQIRRDGGAPNMRVGRLNSLMATRLENALILALAIYKDVRPGIVCRAGDAAPKGATYADRVGKETPAGQAQLLAAKYPRAWGDQMVDVDAFLTGEVNFSRDMKRAVVTICVFDNRHPGKLQKLAQFETETTRGMLDDMGVDYIVRGTFDGPDPGAAKKANKRPDFSARLQEIKEMLPLPEISPGVPDPNDPKKIIAAKDDTIDEPPPSPLAKVLKFDVYYGNKIQKDFEKNPRPPKLGQSVHFEVENLTAQQLGLVLRVNGINTVDDDRQIKDSDKYARWVLSPKTRYGIYGFYKRDRDGDKGKERANAICAPFIAAELSQLEYASDLVVQTKLGKIELDVFVPVKDEPRADLTRSLGEPAERKASFEELAQAVNGAELRALQLPAEGSRELILLDKNNKINVYLGQKKFTGRHSTHATIPYAPPPPAQFKAGGPRQ